MFFFSLIALYVSCAFAASEADLEACICKIRHFLLLGERRLYSRVQGKQPLLNAATIDESCLLEGHSFRSKNVHACITLYLPEAQGERTTHVIDICSI
jgi:hypothetical protein